MGRQSLKREFSYLEHEYFSCRPVDIELAVGWIVGIDTLASEEVDDLLRSVFVSISGSDLEGLIENTITLSSILNNAPIAPY